MSRKLLTGIVWWGILWFFLELSLLIHFFLRLIQIAHFFSTLCLLTYFNAWHSDELTNVLNKNIQLYQRKKALIDPSKVSLFFLNFNKICDIFVSKRIFPNVLLTFLVTNIPIHIYIIKGFVFDRDDPFIRFAMTLIFAMQNVAFYISLNPLAYVCKRLHAPLKVLVPLQHCLNGQEIILDKLKVDDLIKRLGVGPKNAVSIGPLNEVTRKALIEVK